MTRLPSSAAPSPSTSALAVQAALAIHPGWYSRPSYCQPMWHLPANVSHHRVCITCPRHILPQITLEGCISLPDEVKRWRNMGSFPYSEIQESLSSAMSALTVTTQTVSPTDVSTGTKAQEGESVVPTVGTCAACADTSDSSPHCLGTCDAVLLGTTSVEPFVSGPARSSVTLWKNWQGAPCFCEGNPSEGAHNDYTDCMRP